MRVHIYGRCATACYSGISFTPFIDFHVSGFSFSFCLYPSGVAHSKVPRLRYWTMSPHKGTIRLTLKSL